MAPIITKTGPECKPIGCFLLVNFLCSFREEDTPGPDMPPVQCHDFDMTPAAVKTCVNLGNLCCLRQPHADPFRYDYRPETEP